MLITFANILGPDQAQQTVKQFGSRSGGIPEGFFEKKNEIIQQIYDKNGVKLPSMQLVKVLIVI